MLSRSCSFASTITATLQLEGNRDNKTSEMCPEQVEGDHLKEASSINKSLSTLGHIIMVVVDAANGKPWHITFRDSKLTFSL
ncbi:hypothetical protein HRI_002240300 [Hibiscus trionum]|uniref:Kinesin motor domain-containing protein n=1 Tax=Hibiscus trionum TaxID=183268 RepID=A0A9W7HWJ6_HIBTR|nr:hypothetical protein HRI_002240300 [Hibiscus trionum]